MGSVGISNFSSSVVTSEVYHGTDISNITSFNLLGKESNGAIFFAADEDYATEEAYVKNEKSGRGQVIYSVNLNIKNPLYVTLSETDFANPIKERPYIEQAKKAGYDAVIFTNDVKEDWEKQTFYAVFKPSQIKIKNKRIIR